MAIVINQYLLAWQKLLELVVFGQKSEALGLAKLLGHFMDDKILALQLQADLYLLFNEIAKSTELYKRIFYLYAQNCDKDKSNAILEHLKLL